MGMRISELESLLDESREQHDAAAPVGAGVVSVMCRGLQFAQRGTSKSTLVHSRRPQVSCLG